MFLRDSLRKHSIRVATPLVAILCAGVWSALPACADESERTTVNVYVRDAVTDQPVAFARLTLQYQEEGSKLKLKRGKTISLNAKTNPQGRYKFTNIPKGTIRLMVISDQRQTFGQEFELEQDNQVIEVKLRKPQPLL